MQLINPSLNHAWCLIARASLPLSPKDKTFLSLLGGLWYNSGCISTFSSSRLGSAYLGPRSQPPITVIPWCPRGTGSRTPPQNQHSRMLKSLIVSPLYARMQNSWIWRVIAILPPKYVIFLFFILIFMGFLLLKSNLFTVILVKFRKRIKLNVHIQSAIFNQRSLSHFSHGLIFKVILKYQPHCLLPQLKVTLQLLRSEFKAKERNFS